MGVVTPDEHPPMTGLTPFIVAMIKAPRDRLARADHQKLAEKYGIPAAWVSFYLANWEGGR